MANNDNNTTFCSLFEDDEGDQATKQNGRQTPFNVDEVLSGATIYKSMEANDNDFLAYSTPCKRRNKNITWKNFCKTQQCRRSLRLSQKSGTKINYAKNKKKKPQNKKITNISQNKVITNISQDNGTEKRKRGRPKCSEIDNKKNDFILEIKKIHEKVTEAKHVYENVINWTKYLYCSIKDIEFKLENIIDILSKRQKEKRFDVEHKRLRNGEISQKGFKENRVQDVNVVDAEICSQLLTEIDDETQTFRNVDAENETIDCSRILSGESVLENHSSKPWQNKDFWKDKTASIPKQWLEDINFW